MHHKAEGWPSKSSARREKGPPAAIGAFDFFSRAALRPLYHNGRLHFSFAPIGKNPVRETYKIPAAPHPVRWNGWTA
jgi:hypothetical protein